MRSKNAKRAPLPLACGQRKGPLSDAWWGEGLRRTDRPTQRKLSHRPLHEGKYRDDAVAPKIAARRQEPREGSSRRELRCCCTTERRTGLFAIAAAVDADGPLFSPR